MKPLHRDTSAIPEPLMNGGGVLVLGTIDSSGEHLDLGKHLLLPLHAFYGAMVL